MSSPIDPAQNDNSLVDDGEYLLRRFPNEGDKFDFVKKIPLFASFLPSKADTDGLSLNREGFMTAEDFLSHSQSPNMKLCGGVAAVLASWVRKEGMTIVSATAELPGHVLIPEINRKDYDFVALDGSRELKHLIQGLADKLARAAEIRISPKPKNQIPS